METADGESISMELTTSVGAVVERAAEIVLNPTVLLLAARQSDADGERNRKEGGAFKCRWYRT
jgi:hypothetical protein